jgi:hypothetical protein
LLVFRNGTSKLLTYEAQVRRELADAQASLTRLQNLLASAATTNIAHLTNTVIPEQEAALTQISAQIGADTPPDRGALAGIRKTIGEITAKVDEAYWRAKQDALLTGLQQ